MPFRKAPASREQVLDALRPVRDPFFHRSVVELGLVEVHVERSRVHLTVLLPVEMPSPTAFVDQVRAAVADVTSGHAVDVSVRTMDDAELAGLRARLPGADVEGVPFSQASSSTRVLGISSGKGGVGKSSVTVNLALALAQRGHDTAILDADVYGFSVPKMLGIERPPIALDGLIVPPLAYGVKCISMGFFAEDDQPIIWRGPMLHKALEQFLTDVYWGEPDFLLVDMPPGTGDVALSVAQFTPRSEIYVVTTPQPAAQRVAQRSALMAQKVNLEVRGVIENMSWFTGDDRKRYELFGSGGGQALAERLDVPLVGQVPLVTALREGGDVGRPIMAVDPDGDAGRAFAGVADWVEGHGPKRIFRPELTIR